MLGTAVCLIVSAGVWLAIRSQQPMWPLPDLYLLEIAAVSCLCTWGIWSNGTSQASLRGILSWAAIGIVLGFVILGAFSIGFFYLPVAGLLGSTAILADLRQRHNLIIHLGVGLAAAIAQAVIMLAIIRMI
jgi:hypothetical protein